MTDSDDKRGSAAPEGDAPGGFRVIDRRRFDADGEERVPGEESPSSAAGSEDSGPAPGQDPGFVLREAPGETATSPAPEANLSSLFLGLSTQALLHLGEIPDPESGEATRDLASARSLIDLLAVLRDKTQGNLDAEEARLLDRILYDLRMRFVEIARDS